MVWRWNCTGCGVDFQLAFMSEALPVVQAGIPAVTPAVVTGVMPGAVSQAVAPKMPASMFASLVEELFSAPVVAVAAPKIAVQTLPARPRTERRDEVPVKLEKLKGELVVFAAVIPYVVIPDPMQMKVGLGADAPKVRAEAEVVRVARLKAATPAKSANLNFVKVCSIPV